MSEDDDDPYPYDDETPDDESERCMGCGADIFCDEHDWDCPYAGEDDED
jgi:hypothetical protein